MRFPIIPFFLLLFVTSTLAAQSAPAPTAPEIISEDDLKLGIYDAPIFQPAARNFIVRQAEGRAKDGELIFVIGPDTAAPLSYLRSPSYYRVHEACGQDMLWENELAILFEVLNDGTPSRQKVANKE